MLKEKTFNKSKPYLIAHRGYSAIAPENTQLAFSAAKLFGFDGIELDLHLTKDQKLVIIHDENLFRTAWVDKVIKDETLEELKKYNQAAFWNSQVPKQKILTLKEFLKNNLDDFKIINLEIKSDIYEYPQIEEIINLEIQDFQESWDKLIFSSFNFQSLKRLYKINPQLNFAFLWWTKTQFNNVAKIEDMSFIKYFNPWIDIYFEDQIKYDSYQKAYIFWTFKSKAKYSLFKKLPRCYGLISNYHF